MNTPHRKLLIVEDSQGWKTQLAGLLQERYPNAQILTATSLGGAERILDSTALDIAIVDLRLDDSDETNQDGLIVARKIREKSSHTEIFLLTAYATLASVQEARRPDENGRSLVSDFFEKSETPDLIDRIEQIWGNR